MRWFIRAIQTAYLKNFIRDFSASGVLMTEQNPRLRYSVKKAERAMSQIAHREQCASKCPLPKRRLRTGQPTNSRVVFKINWKIRPAENGSRRKVHR